MVGDMEKWLFSSTFQEKKKMDFLLGPFFLVADEIRLRPFVHVADDRPFVHAADDRPFDHVADDILSYQ